MPWLLSLLALVFVPPSPIIPDFGVREFQSKEQMQTFLQGLGFLSMGNKPVIMIFGKRNLSPMYVQSRTSFKMAAISPNS